MKSYEQEAHDELMELGIIGIEYHARFQELVARKRAQPPREVTIVAHYIDSVIDDIKRKKWLSI